METGVTLTTEYAGGYCDSTPQIGTWSGTNFPERGAEMNRKLVRQITQAAIVLAAVVVVMLVMNWLF